MKSLAHCIRSRESHIPEIDEQTVLFAMKKHIALEYGKRGIESILPQSFKEGVLSIRTTSSIWASELFQEKERLRCLCNEEFSPKKPIRKIIVA
jgi:hypothetical protein